MKCAGRYNNIYSACMRSPIAKFSMRCRKVRWCQTVPRWVVSPSESSLSGVCILSCWSLKPIITVFCQKLKADYGGGKEGAPPAHQSFMFISSQAEATLLWWGVFAQTSSGNGSSERLYACEYRGVSLSVISTKDDDMLRTTLMRNLIFLFLWSKDTLFFEKR